MIRPTATFPDAAQKIFMRYFVSYKKQEYHKSKYKNVEKHINYATEQ